MNSEQKNIFPIFLLVSFLSALSITHLLGEVLGETNEPEFLLIAKYYDNRKAVVTISADDWENSWWQEFEEMRCGEIMSNRFSSLFSYAEYEYKLANESVIPLLKYWNISLRNKKLLNAAIIGLLIFLAVLIA